MADFVDPLTGRKRRLAEDLLDRQCGPYLVCGGCGQKIWKDKTGFSSLENGYTCHRSSYVRLDHYFVAPDFTDMEDVLSWLTE